MVSEKSIRDLFDEYKKSIIMLSFVNKVVYNEYNP